MIHTIHNIRNGLYADPPPHITTPHHNPASQPRPHQNAVRRNNHTRVREQGNHHAIVERRARNDDV